MNDKNETFEDLKKHMSIAVNVQHWNDLREEAKKKFSIELINQLDSSAYISEVLGMK